MQCQRARNERGTETRRRTHHPPEIHTMILELHHHLRHWPGNSRRVLHPRDGRVTAGLQPVGLIVYFRKCDHGLTTIDPASHWCE